MGLKDQRGLIYTGELYAQPYIANALQSKVIGPFETTTFSIAPENEQISRSSNLPGSSGLARAVISRKKPTKFTLKANALNADIAALFLLAVTSTMTASGGSVTGESVTFTELDTWYKLNARNVSAVAITGKTINVDFVVNAKAGMIMALSTGSYAAGSTASVNYTKGAISAPRASIGALSKSDVKFFGRMVNEETQQESWLEIPKCTVSPSGEIPLIGDSYSEMTLNGIGIKLDSETADVYLDDPVTYS